MSYDLEVYGNLKDEKIIENWKKVMMKNGIKTVFHPEFDLENHSGYIPIKIEFINETIEGYSKGKEYYSGFELYVNNVDEDDYEDFIEMCNDDDNISKEEVESWNKIFMFSAHPRDNTSEFRVMWCAAFSLIELVGGVLFDPQIGDNLKVNDGLKILKERVKEYEESLSKTEIKVIEFDDWE